MLQNNRADLDSVQNNWYDVYRKLKLDILNESSSSISEQIHIRDRISRVYQPRILDLVRAIGTDKEEALKKKQLVSQLQESIDNLLVQEVPRSKRVLGGAVKETPETLPLNKELLQHQVQIHQNQDKELDQLRVLIARQKQIGELINAEVEEQNEMLDRFNEEVDYVQQNQAKDAELRRYYSNLFATSILSAIDVILAGWPNCSFESFRGLQRLMPDLNSRHRVSKTRRYFERIFECQTVVAGTICLRWPS